MNVSDGRRRGLRCITRWLPALGVLAVLAAPAEGQQDTEPFVISQRATISQKLGKTLVSLDYARPLWRGRSDVFGKVVHWGELWTPGANEATVLETSHELTINGHRVEPGRWSMWIIPSRVAEWELVLDPRDSLFHTERPDLTDDQVRFPVEVQEGAAHVEALTWSFPRIAQDGATLRMNWGGYEIPLELDVESIQPSMAIERTEAEPYIGQWRMTFEPGPEGEAMPPATLTISYEDSVLLAKFPPGQFAPPPPDSATVAAAIAREASLPPLERERAEARRKLAEIEGGDFPIVLVPRAEGVFVMGYAEDGVLLEAGYMFFEFELENGRAVRLIARDEEDRIMARGVHAN